MRRGKGDQPGVQGRLGHFHLGDWWLASFTEEERGYIEEKYNPTGDKALTRGNITATTETAAGLLVSLSSWFMGPGDRYLAIRMLEKAETLVEGGGVLDRHLVYGEMIRAYYGERETQPGAFEAAVAACERQIAIGPQAWAAFVSEAEESARKLSEFDGQKRQVDFYPPSHRGFQQLAIVREKQDDFTEALRLCREASSQGWRDGKGDWSDRIARLERRLNNTG
jgi:hypothetical protein